jgi:undecaprenyl-diphosphatase
MDWQTLIDFDKQLLLWINGSPSLFVDSLALTLTRALTWLPLYLSLFYLVLKNNDRVQKILLVLGAAGLCVLIAGTIDDTIVKPTVARWRPTHDPQIGLLVDIVDGYRGGNYGFFSAHASNTFSLTIFFWWLVRSRLLTTSMVLWSLTNCWTRMYLGVHYPGDILVGLLWGAISGSFVYWIYQKVNRRYSTGMNFTSSHYTKTGYLRGDIDIPVSILVFTLLYALIKATFAV